MWQWRIGPENGQSLVEYGLIILLVVVVVVATVVVLGQENSSLYSTFQTEWNSI
ncbi:MAG: Flp family type IVb pilin [Chloroflexi bacterium]|nr:Flp family type IVb pilin [Chloroflexota bacterium]